MLDGYIISDELKQEIINLGHYYQQHKITKTIEERPAFVADDLARLLAKLHKELNIN